MITSNPKSQIPNPQLQPPWRLVLGFGLWVLGFVVAAGFLVGSPPLDAAGRLVTFPGLDGRPSSGLFLEAHDRPAPAVVLVPMLGRTKDDWQAVAQGLADANLNVLAIDLPSTSLPEDPAELLRWPQAVSSAVVYLAGRPDDVRADAIGVAGASLGANLATAAAAGDPAVRSLALISPTLDYRGVRIESALSEYATRPALLMASVHDPYAARSVRALARDASGIRDVRWSTIAAHGTVLLAKDPELVRALVEWFRLTLAVN